MSDDREKQIRERAHAIWLAEGSPSGRHEEHWQQATKEVAGSKSTTVRKPRAKAVPAKAPAVKEAQPAPEASPPVAKQAEKKPSVSAATKKATPNGDKAPPAQKGKKKI